MFYNINTKYNYKYISNVSFLEKEKKKRERE